MDRKRPRALFKDSGIRSPFLLGAASAGAVLFLFFAAPALAPISYEAVFVEGDEQLAKLAEVEEEVFEPIYLKTPEPLRAIYMTQCVAGTPSFREELVRLIDETELNAVVIDIKDYSGKIAFQTDNPALKESVSDTCRATDMPQFVKRLNKKGIYVIGRITVFQDPFYSRAHPELAIKKESATTTIWTDYKGLSFIDAGAREFWDYIVELSKEAHEIGFDELNYDYIRFPSDGNTRDIYYPYSEGNLNEDPYTGKAKVLRNFFRYLHLKLKTEHRDETVPSPVLSADLFGMTTTNSDDLNIGQILEYAEPYFDYIAPMVYPSHYPPGFHGWVNPNLYPYDVVRYSMDAAVSRLLAASSTPSKLRPWLQDFDYGGNYDIAEVRAQIQAVYDAGLDSWMLWAPSNIYTRGALEDAIISTYTESGPTR